MRTVLEHLISSLTSQSLKNLDVIPWSSPILSFGDLESARIATIGLNPSDREFIDASGKELEGHNRRFHTLKSLGLKNWNAIEEEHFEAILLLYKEYFLRNPYDGWFKRLDHLISGTSNSYYFPSHTACHLDLIPFATFSKWMDLDQKKRNTLLEVSIDSLGLLLQHSQIGFVVLNGKTVVDNFEKFADVTFERTYMPEWNLPRKGNDGVRGYAYYGQIKYLGNTSLNRVITVLGYNHNIQSSFGVTREVQSSIRNWITGMITEEINETERLTSCADY
jgi:hypothetical protein